ncbi:RNA-guided endonuclease TnpB family protein [Scytonema sp. PCC 10023]|uniref:RNA-guided endonuclease TnpB family protein n=1 Tax=Scytonema sp. PCC 10023 TaxID=1680591 RepID=UPI0039C6BD25
MVRSSTLSFITEVPLIVNSKQESELLSRFQGGRQLYNACLNEAMARLDLVRNSESYQVAKLLPRTKKKERSEAFKKAREQYRYSEYDLHSFAAITSTSSKWIAQKVDSTAQQKLATRAFKASERVMLGMAKDVRYKVPSRFRSMEGKSNKTGIRWKDDCLVWGKLVLQPIIDSTNPVIRHGLESPVKYVRLLWRILNGKRRWYAQLVNEGLPYQKPHQFVCDGLIGLDLNISNIAYVGDNHADQSELIRKAENAGGSVIKFSTQTTALSQTHLDGSRIKKSLSQRVHRDVTGIPEHHRDLFSAFLSRYVNQNKLVLQNTLNAYSGLEPVLLEAYQRYLTREQVSTSESRQSDSPSERVSNELLTPSQIANKGDKLGEDVA